MLANRVIGPVFLVVGLLVTVFMLESEAIPLVKESLENGMTPGFGFVAVKVGLPLLIAYCGILLMKVKRVTHKKTDREQ